MTVTIEDRLSTVFSGPAPTPGDSADSVAFVDSLLAGEQRRAQRGSVGFALSTLALILGLGSAIWLNRPSAQPVSTGTAATDEVGQGLAPIVIEPAQNGLTGFGSALRVAVTQMAPAFIVGALILVASAVLVHRVRRVREMPRWRGRILRGVAAVVLLTTVAFQVGFDVYFLPSNSMSPTLVGGDRVLVDPDDRDVEVGDIVIVRALRQPVNPGDTFPQVRRVMGVGGDVVEFQDGQIVINGRSVAGWAGAAAPLRDFETGLPEMAALTVPVGELILLGDNHSASIDSRSEGTAYGDDVLGTVKWRTGG